MSTRKRAMVLFNSIPWTSLYTIKQLQETYGQLRSKLICFLFRHDNESNDEEEKVSTTIGTTHRRWVVANRNTTVHCVIEFWQSLALLGEFKDTTVLTSLF